MSEDAAAPATSDQIAARPPAREALTTEAFLCPLCLDFIHQPVGLHCCGSSFCLPCIKSSLRSSANCPLCRKPCYLNLASARPNMFLTSALEALFPAESAARKEAELASQATASTDCQLGLFLFPLDRGGTTRIPPPGSPVTFKFFEMRYVVMARRAAENGTAFGLMPRVDAPIGMAVAIESMRELPGGSLWIEGRCENRFRVLAPPEMSQGDYGLWSALVQPFTDYRDDNSHEDDSLEAVLRQVPLTETTKRKLRRMGSKAAATGALKSAVADAIVRVLSGLSPSVTTGVLRRVHGDTPPSAGPAGSAEKWSFYAADLLALDTVKMIDGAAVPAPPPVAAPAAADGTPAPPAIAAAVEPQYIDAPTETITTRSTLKRLALCYCFLEMVAAEVRREQEEERRRRGPPQAAPAESNAAQPAAADATGGAGAGAAVNNNADDGASLDVFAAEITAASATRVLASLYDRRPFGGLLTPASYFRSIAQVIGSMILQPRAFARSLAVNPLISSMLVFTVIIALLLFFGNPSRRHRGRMINDDGYYL